MNIVMAGIDYQTADLSLRGKFSLTESEQQRVLEEIYGTKGVLGCVLLSTCNRTEIYLELEENTELSPGKALCQGVGLPHEKYREFFREQANHQAVEQLFYVTSGLGSQLLGDDQVLTQVHKAGTFARENKTTNSVLETLFRLAVSSGKKIKTQVPLYAVERSVAGIGIQTLQERLTNLSGKKALVIGNGEMGRLSADLLVQAGAEVTITLRSYKHGETVVPRGCTTVPYDKRYDVIPRFDVLVSATASNHCTLTKANLEALSRIPSYIVDLAVPRDVESLVDTMEGVTCWNVDDLVEPENQINQEKIQAIEKIREEYQQEFYRWYTFRKQLLLEKEVSHG